MSLFDSDFFSGVEGAVSDASSNLAQGAVGVVSGIVANQIGGLTGGKRNLTPEELAAGKTTPDPVISPSSQPAAILSRAAGDAKSVVSSPYFLLIAGVVVALLIFKRR